MLPRKKESTLSLKKVAPANPNEKERGERFRFGKERGLQGLLNPLWPYMNRGKPKRKEKKKKDIYSI